MEVKGFVFFVREVLNVMDMNETVQGRRYDIVQVRIEFDLGDPTFVNLLLNNLDAMFFFQFVDVLVMVTILETHESGVRGTQDGQQIFQRG